ncbi:hypothetical protein AQ490_19090 [Wenjunlia vitaminophila]|uniref:Uncharacterized protein n=1 Tax=Wenjunlia vitaminophila TaxID=76728 RepID=A0A0T6LUW5_WENVI|nr:hypothetical protein [Wenjunlia vitaminophila]KRV49801.1 hypothetical protein AQ490_19090 [Wenjunlia vitaminophila]
MDPLNESELSADALDLVARAAPGYLDALPDRPVSDPASWHRLADLGGPLPEDGEGTLATVGRLIDVGTSTSHTQSVCSGASSRAARPMLFP